MPRPPRLFYIWYLPTSTKRKSPQQGRDIVTHKITPSELKRASGKNRPDARYILIYPDFGNDIFPMVGTYTSSGVIGFLSRARQAQAI